MSERSEFKMTELREMRDDELMELLADLKKELFDLKFQHAIHDLDDPMEIARIKRDMDRIETILNERKAEAKE